MCGFHGDFIVMPDGTLYALTKDTAPHGESEGGCCCGPDPAAKNREFVGRRWERRDVRGADVSEPEAVGCCCGADAGEPEAGVCCCETGTNEPELSGCCCGADTGEPCGESPLDMTNMEVFLDRAKSHGFTITSMAFQDAGNLDIERLRQCSLHVYKDGKHIPFCAYYLSPHGEKGNQST